MVALLLISLVLLTLSTPFSSCAPQTSENGLTTKPIWRKTATLGIDKSCTPNQARMIAQLKADATAILQAQKLWDPIQGFYQPAMKLYLGADSSSDRSLGWFKGNYRSIIQTNYQRLRLGLLGKGDVQNYDYWWFCPSENDKWSQSICSKGPTGNGWSYYWFNGFGPPYYYWTALCPEFWQMSTLASVIKKIDAGKAVRTDMNSYFPTQDLYFMAAFLELSPVVSDPQATPGPVTPFNVVALAKGKNTAGAYTSSFNYIYAAIAIYLQSILHLNEPPSPKSPKVVLPVSVSNIYPIGNATSVTPPDPPPTRSGAPDPSIWAVPTIVSDTPLDSAVAIYQSELSASQLAASQLSTSQHSTSQLSASAAAAVPAPTPTPTRAFEILFKQGWPDGDVEAIPVDAWTVYSHPISEATNINPCKTKGFASSSATGTAISFPTALGAFTDGPYSGCTYRGLSIFPGSVSCPGSSTWRQCGTATASATQCWIDGSWDQFTAQVECQF